MREETAYWLAVSRLPGVGAKRAQLLRAHFGSGAAVWKASAMELQFVLGWDGQRLGNLIAKRRSLDPEELLTRVERAGAWVTVPGDEGYPDQLLELFDPPAVLYGWGARLSFDSHRLAIVGARRMTGYGQQVVDQLVADLAEANPVIVSGLARGVDGQAHQAALRNKFVTWAVLGSGFGHIYPPENRNLAMQIVSSGGTLLTEYWPDVSPLPYHFPARNRIIAALAQAVLVVEADEQSGALITVDHALDLGRDVFAVPGNITNRFSRGTNLLLKQGAGMVTGAADILSTWGLGAVGQPQALPELTPLERHVYQLLEDNPTSFDQLVQRADLTTGEALAALTSLEIKGLAAVDALQCYRRLGRY